VITPDDRFAWQRFGAEAGMPVLAWHGTPSVGGMYAFADAAARAADLTLIAPDRPGYGATPARAEARASFSAVAADGAALMRSLGHERFAVLGISGGGPYAAATAALFPARVVALALVVPVGLIADPGPDFALPRSARFAFQVAPRWQRTSTLAARLVTAMFARRPETVQRLVMATAPRADRRVLSDPSVRQLLLATSQAALRQGPAAFVADVARFGRPWGIDPVQIQCPVVFWQGTADRRVPPVAAFALGARIPGCRVHRLDGEGHFWVFAHAPVVLGELARLARDVTLG
jgi:pimeloyl-ACP methyl ester carboxylesterase